ncbi:MAG: hypothetical protein R3E91_03785 [Chlamydiales bacterium]
MPDNRISEINPIPPNPDRNPTHSLGDSQETENATPFSLPSSKDKAEFEMGEIKKTPMDFAREQAQQNIKKLTPEQLNHAMEGLQNQLGDVATKLKNPNITKKFTEDHYEALDKIVEEMSSDMGAIGKHTNQTFPSAHRMNDESPLSYITRWINGSQQTLSSAINFIGKDKNPNPASFLKLQYSVQRAVQRGELFASIVGASVSGIKTIMSTQLG